MGKMGYSFLVIHVLHLDTMPAVLLTKHQQQTLFTMVIM